MRNSAVPRKVKSWEEIAEGKPNSVPLTGQKKREEGKPLSPKKGKSVADPGMHTSISQPKKIILGRKKSIPNLTPHAVQGTKIATPEGPKRKKKKRRARSQQGRNTPNFISK